MEKTRHERLRDAAEELWKIVRAYRADLFREYVESKATRKPEMLRHVERVLNEIEGGK